MKFQITLKQITVNAIQTYDTFSWKKAFARQQHQVVLQI